jgi:integral membrane protein
MNTPLSRLRLIGFIEGVSYLVLLGIAMPLKYFAGYPLAVKYTGWAHGVLFVAFGCALLNVWISRKWPFSKVFKAFIASLLPFGTFILDKSLKAEEASMQH